MPRLFLALTVAVLVLSSCNSGDLTKQDIEPDIARSISIAPDDFALLPCKGARATDSCIIVAAGGKRILFGAPASAMSAIDASDLISLDGVMLFSLRADDTEGLDTYRNRSWRAGRRSPALIYGPSGTDKLVAGLNMAFEASDAITFLEAPPRGGFTSALLQARTASGSSDLAFDTGDLRIRSQTINGSDLFFDVLYAGQSVTLVPCREGIASADKVYSTCGEAFSGDAKFIIRG